MSNQIAQYSAGRAGIPSKIATELATASCSFQGHFIRFRVPVPVLGCTVPEAFIDGCNIKSLCLRLIDLISEVSHRNLV
jgi:hypothetical protein